MRPLLFRGVGDYSSLAAPAPPMSATHEVFNQADPLRDYNLYATNRPLLEALAFQLPLERRAAAGPRLHALGEELGRRETFARAEAANRNPPVLRAFDARGRRRDEVEFHPAWHDLMTVHLRHGLHTGPWAEPGPGAHVERAAGYLLYSEVENGTQCPVTMTYGSVPALGADLALAAEWLPRLFSRVYDPAFRPAAEKMSALIGMGMTEKQGGSDVRANTTRAVAAGGGSYRVTGHKWFFSAPMCDAWLILAQAPGGLSCFFLPRFTPDGTLNAIRIQRLKDKLGNRSNASAEVEFEDAHASLLGEEGRGIPIILEMGVYTRLDCAIGTAGLMRQALTRALWNAAHRRTFGRLLREHALMKNVLADLALECEAATALVLRLARAFDDPAEERLRRVLTPVAKYWVCKRGAHFAQEAMEAIGGNGYVEEDGLARIYREMPLNSIWEGSGNVMCLDVLRGLRKDPASADALRAELLAARGVHPAYDRYLAGLQDRLAASVDDEGGARRLAQDVALAAQAGLLLRHAPSPVADAFCASRIAREPPAAFGTLPSDAPFDMLIERAMPVEAVP
jgi:putative acyl-CoA dehydrogenase